MAKHSISLPQSGMSPSNWYAVARSQPGFALDPAQAQAIMRLDQLYQELLDFKRVRSRPLGKLEIFGHALMPQPKLPKGLYLWGGVGRGKSLLMDVFYAGLPYLRKRRLHFHDFMREVHLQLKTLKGQPDPLLAVARRIAMQTRVLCFDEFHISDIADAMILGRLFSFLFNQGVIMVLTSNYPPENLYPNGLQRSSFLPTIALLQQMLDVVNLDGGVDHRQRLLTKAPLYLVPHDEESMQKLQVFFDELAGTVSDDLPHVLEISGYRLESRRRARNVVWFDFDVLCGPQRSQVDYLYLARNFEYVLVSGIPVLESTQAAEARRLTWLIDIFYDYRVKLIATAADLPQALYLHGEQSGEFVRTASRLQEMQTQEYWDTPYEKPDFVQGITET